MTYLTLGYQFPLQAATSFSPTFSKQLPERKTPLYSLQDRSSGSNGDVKIQASFIRKIETLLKLLAFNRIFEDWEQSEGGYGLFTIARIIISLITSLHT